jgi:hypothetical protein
MRKMAGAKPVHNPLSMTNMLLKSPTYHKAYELWKFIDSYEKLGITYSVKETNQEFDDTYYKEIYGLVMGDILTLNSHQIDTTEVAPSLSKKKILTPRVLLSLDDETFLDGKFTYHEFPQADDNKKRAPKGTMAPQKEDIEQDQDRRTEASFRRTEESRGNRGETSRMETEARS